MGACCVSAKPDPLVSATYENTVPFQPSFTRARLVKCYDGDTIWVAAEQDGKVMRFNIRMMGYDSPELKGSSANEKQAAIIARNALEELLGNAPFRVEISPVREKYGRILATCWVQRDGAEINVSNWMVEHGYGYPYFGGTKKAFDS